MDSSDRDKLRKRLKKEDAFVAGIPSITGRAHASILQNNVIDLYERYFDEEDNDVHASEPPSTKTAAVFRSPPLFSLHVAVVELVWHCVWVCRYTMYVWLLRHSLLIT